MKIIAYAPSRLSFIGGGTDIESYYKNYGGYVINMAINLRQRVELYKEDDTFHLIYNKFPVNGNPELFYKIFENYGVNGHHHVRILSSFDGIIGAGLGSSAAACVCLIGALRRSQGLDMDKDMIAEEAYHTEVFDMGWAGGRQDQYAAAYGGFNQMSFGDGDKIVEVNPFHNGYAENLLPYLLLFYIGGTRESRKIQKGFERLSKKQIKALDHLKENAEQAFHHIIFNEMEDLGYLLHETWQFKKESNKGVSNSRIDDIYDYALKNGAWGGKIMGAGGAGYMLFMCPPEKRNYLIGKMKEKHIEQIDFNIDYNGLETRIESDDLMQI